MKRTYIKAYCHMVFASKERRYVIPEELDSEISDYLKRILESYDCIFHASGIGGDHIHILFELSPIINLSEAARYSKIGTSKIIKNCSSSLESFRWQRGYGVFTFDSNQLPRLLQYVQNQRQHHSK